MNLSALYMLVFIRKRFPPKHSHYAVSQTQYPLVQICHPKSRYSELAGLQRNTSHFIMHSFRNSCSHHHTTEVLIICWTFSAHELIIWDALTSQGPYWFSYLPPSLDSLRLSEKGTILLIFVSAPGTVLGTKSVLSMWTHKDEIVPSPHFRWLIKWE